jgi:choline-sulfatase
MRILYIDIDSLRPDHLGCYGYHRDTSPNIDSITTDATRFENCYVSDSPCMPSRTALFSGRFGFQTGVVGHGGTSAQPFVEGEARSFDDTFARTSWMSLLGKLGYRTASVSSFGQRHGAWHWYAGFNEVMNSGGGGNEIADDVTPLALDWISRHGKDENWFLHVNYWDAHLHFRTPLEFGNPFEDDPPPDWITQDYLDQSQDACGMRCAPEALGGGWGTEDDLNSYKDFPREPSELKTLDDIKTWIDGYDVAVRYVDTHIGYLFDRLTALGVMDDVVVVISSDHGESLGELNIWGGHHLADYWINHVPLVVRFPGKTDGGQVDNALHYQFDWAATLVELLGGDIPDIWDGKSFADSFNHGDSDGRDYLVLSHAAMTAQRSVRFGDHQYIRTYHDGYKLFEPELLYDIVNDPHEIHNLANEHPELINQATHHLIEWHNDMIAKSSTAIDPMVTVLKEGGPYHSRGKLYPYLKRLRDTGRTHLADRLIERHMPNEKVN